MKTVTIELTSAQARDICVMLSIAQRGFEREAHTWATLPRDEFPNALANAKVNAEQTNKAAALSQLLIEARVSATSEDSLAGAGK